MDVREIRVGSIVSHEDYTEGIFEVESISYDSELGVYMVNTLGGKNGSWINPIENLIPVCVDGEFLMNNGFEFYETPDRCGYKKGIITICRESAYVGDTAICLVEHVHELQNLYYAIYGEELVWK